MVLWPAILPSDVPFSSPHGTGLLIRYADGTMPGRPPGTRLGCRLWGARTATTPSNLQSPEADGAPADRKAGRRYIPGTRQVQARPALSRPRQVRATMDTRHLRSRSVLSWAGLLATITVRNHR
jgi:hypothetical protein